MHTRLIIVCLVELAILFSVEAVSMSVTPSSMVVGSANSVTRLELRCSSDGTNNYGIYSLQIARRRFTEIGYSSLVIIDILDGIKQDPNMPTDIVAKSPNITGGLVGTPPTSGTLILTMDGSSITCNDQAEFKCEMTYKITGIAGSQTSSFSNNFTVITVPSDFRITDALYEDKGIQLQLTNDSRLVVGSRITYRCSANIGSNSSLAIVWERSSMLGASTDFTTYTPTVSTDIVQDPVVQGSCSYTRTSTMYYNMTSLDDDGITFRCKVHVYVGNQWYEPTSIPRRTFTISASSVRSAVDTGGQEGSSGNSSTVLAAALGVVVGVLVILLIILSLFLHRSRKLTKELQSQLQSRSPTYNALVRTIATSEPYAILNVEPTDNHLQSDYLNPYDRLNRTVGSSESYNMLESRHSDNHLQSDYLNPYDRLNRTVESSEPYNMLESRHSDANVHKEVNML